MSAQGLTSEAQLRYLLQWFGEFSELQKEDFLPILAAAKANRPDLLASTLAGLTCDDKPVSLFQCRIPLSELDQIKMGPHGKHQLLNKKRTMKIGPPDPVKSSEIKLFNEWYPSWTEDHQDRLMKGVSETDPEFAKKLGDLLENGPQVIENGPQFENGQNGTEEAESTVEPQLNGHVENEEVIDIQESPEPAVQEAAPIEIAAAS